jgi:putative permease
VIAIIKVWFNRYFSDPEAVLLALLLIGGFTLVITMGHILAPLFASMVIAYLLQWLVNVLRGYKVPKLLSVIIVYSAFLSLFFGALFFIWPLAWRQLSNLLDELPAMLNRVQAVIYWLPEKFPELFSPESAKGLSDSITQQLRGAGKSLLSVSLASIPSVIALAIYAILVPLMVFFFLKDHVVIINYCTAYLPKRRGLLKQVWQEMDMQLGNYVRGKVVEVAVVGIATYVLLIWMDLRYAELLSTLVGFSVLIPYIGAMVVTIPVLLVGLFQWGISSELMYLAIGYFIIQGIDGNILVPLLFSEAVNLHPVAIIIAVLVFGGIWGFWGVFFAIPLATLVKAVLNAWPKHGELTIKPSYSKPQIP